MYADYDMCTPCITDRRHEHAQSHEFFKIEEPGHVIVHTVFSENEDKQSRHSQTGMCQSEQGPNQNLPVVHNATCDLCDSRIRGDRFVSRLSMIRIDQTTHTTDLQKCLNCPGMSEFLKQMWCVDHCYRFRYLCILLHVRYLSLSTRLNCFLTLRRITSEQHPGHSFVNITDPLNLIVRCILFVFFFIH
jgi:hypothetical protein